MTSEDEMGTNTIGKLEPINGPVELAPYSSEWPALFARLAVRVRTTLGQRALMLEHVGSTSIPGLAAKPIIDVLLAVANSADERTYAPDMEATGFVLRIREPQWYEHRLFKHADPDANVHVLSAGCPEIEKMLLFRDWLRSNPVDRELYARTKRELGRRTWRYVQDYADAKTAVVEEIVARARAAAAH